MTPGSGKWEGKREDGAPGALGGADPTPLAGSCPGRLCSKVWPPLRANKLLASLQKDKSKDQMVRNRRRIIVLRGVKRKHLGRRTDLVLWGS